MINIGATRTANATADRARFILPAGPVRGLAVRVLSLAGALALWWAMAAARVVDPQFLPGPHAVWNAFVRANSWHQLAPGVPRRVPGEQNYFLWEHLVASLQRIAVGAGAAVSLGPLVGFALGTSKTLAAVVGPYLNFLRTLPPLGYIGLLIVWFGIGDTSKIWLLFLAAFPPVMVATIAGVQGVSADRVNAARSLGANRIQVVTRVLLPATLPEVIGGIRVAVGFAWTTVVAAELDNGTPGIGGLAFLAGQQLNTPLTMACIIVIGLTALALDAVISWIGTLAVPWKGKA
ncbi:ABC transporter permease [Nocardia seriolae]|uniref:Taurine ABC transporter permease n=1 Tax=Nocardia seriolae TaxID=37332 RepID=A0ABC9YVA8_9NOCA|nr:ABC transporter permease [Nocardia seriolae]GAM47506.1 taurine ABC transporter permease [Nocardia seriolae]GAP29368.1 taurine ABC transporter permease [Nocardia seriolae]